MNKNEIIDHIAKVLGDRKQAQAAIDSIIVQISDALKMGETVTLSGFGTFKRVQREARKGINPRTGEKIMIKARQATRFIPSSRLQKAVN